MLNIPGPAGVTCTCTPLLDIPRRVERTVKVSRPGGISGGNCASICVGDVVMRGMATSLTVTQIPPSERGNGVAAACAGKARLFPRIVTSAPGETNREPLALLIIPVALNTGVAPVVGDSDTMLKPETVRRYALLLLS